MDLLLLLAIGAAAFGLFWWSSEDRRIKHQLRHAPTYSLGEMPEAQLGRLIGQAVVLREQLAGPISGRPCVYYIAKVEEYRSTGRFSNWKTIITEARGVPFVLQDGTGRAIVDATGAKIALDFDTRSRSGTFDNPTENERAFLDRHGEHGRRWIFNKHLRYREAIIEIGETIAVLGAGTREPDPSATPTGYRDDQPTLLRLTSSSRYPLVISDDPSTLRRD